MPKNQRDSAQTTSIPRKGYLPDEIARKLSEQISAGVFAVGDRLPSERDLCTKYSVSRAVVREALSQLKADGLVSARAGSGVYLKQQGATNVFRLQKFSISDEHSLAQAMELLVSIEVAATSIAARRRTKDDLKKIKRMLIGMEYAIANEKLGDEEDFLFHQAIVEATHNEHFIALCKHLEASARNIIRQARSNTRINHVEQIEAVQDEHKAIYRALEDGDEAEAARAAETHLSNAAARIRIFLKSPGTASNERADSKT